MNKIQFSLLQYIHNPSTHERVNLAFVLYCPATGEISLEYPDNYCRIETLYPKEFNVDYYRCMINAFGLQFKCTHVINGSLEKIIDNIYPIKKVSDGSYMSFTKPTHGVLYTSFDKELDNLKDFYLKYFKMNDKKFSKS
jgi:hypothetical protein